VGWCGPVYSPIPPSVMRCAVGLIEASSRELWGATSQEDEVFDMALPPSFTPRKRQATPRRNYGSRGQK